MTRFLFILAIVCIHYMGTAQGSNRIITNYTGSIKQLKGVNSPYQDFSLVISGSEAYFASSREQSMIHYKENNWKNTAKINVFKGDVSQLDDYYEVNIQNIGPFIELKDEFTHVGPLCFSVTGDTMFFTKVPVKFFDKSIKLRKPQLFMLVKQDGKWAKTPQQLPFNNPLFVFAHPTYNSSTQTLYFVSDKTGGVGGKDIYSVTHKNGRWQTPVNVKAVNTKGDELFPFIANDQTLFFSSNRSESTGGLDVFYSEGAKSEAQNLTFVNSLADDFGIFMVEDKNIGFLSSNRDGNDDLYTFTVNKEKNLKNSLFGKFKYRKLNEAIEQPLTVFLLNEKKEPVQEALVDENGEFEFFDIALTEEYTIKAKSKAEMDLVLYDGEGNPDERLLADERHEFVYKMVDIKDVGELNLKQIDEKGNSFIAGRFFYEDKTWEEPGKLTVNLIAPNGKVEHTVTSDEKGYFDFTKLPSDKDYIVKLAEENADLTLIIFNKDGKIVEKLKDDGSGLYLFRQLKVLKINDLNEKNYLREEAFSFDSGMINGDFDKDGENVDFQRELIVSVYNENGDLIDTITADKNGVFVYNKLTGIENYLFQLDQMGEDFDLSGISLKILDDKGKLIKEVFPQSDGSFQYRSLEILNIQALQNMNSVDEGEFDLMGAGIPTTEGMVKYNDKQVNIPGGLEVSIYNDKNELLEKQRTDLFGKFKFKTLLTISEYNLEITEKPDSMQLELFTIDFISSETNGKIKYNNKDIKVPGGVQVSIFNENNELQETHRTDMFGNFKFKSLATVEEYNLEITEKPDSMDMALFQIDLKSPSSENPISLLPSGNGGFKYRKLEMLDVESNLTNLSELNETVDLIFDINGNYDYDNKEGNFPSNLKVYAYDGNGNKIGEVFTDRFGNFVFKKLPGISTVLFKIEGMPEGFDLDKFSLFIEEEDGKQLAKLRSGEKGFFVYKPLGFASDLPLDLKERLDDKVEHAVFGTNALDLTSEIESVYFGSNKTNPNSSDVLKIEKMLLLLEINDGSKIEINAYADSRASDNYNLILSERRAEWVKNYLMRKGISENRVIINAYGEGKLVNDCEDGVDCPDKEHALNRRAELRIIN